MIYYLIQHYIKYKSVDWFVNYFKTYLTYTFLKGEEHLRNYIIALLKEKDIPITKDDDFIVIGMPIENTSCLSITKPNAKEHAE